MCRMPELDVTPTRVQASGHHMVLNGIERTAGTGLCCEPWLQWQCHPVNAGGRRQACTTTALGPMCQCVGEEHSPAVRACPSEYL